MNISILIPTWKRPEKLTKCLQALVGQTLPPLEVLVSYKPEDSESLRVLESFTTLLPLKKVEVRSPGVIHAENQLIKAATGDILAFIDDDAYAYPRWVETIQKHFLDDPELYGLGGPDIIIGDDKNRYDKSVFGKMTWYGKVVGNHHHRGTGIHEVSILKGVNMAFRREGLPLLDEALSSERYKGNGCHWELDLCLGLKNKKLIFDTKHEVQHESDHSDIIEADNAYNNARNYSYVYFKHFSPLRRCIFLLYCALVGNARLIGIAKFVQLVFKGKALYAFKAYHYSTLGIIEGIKMYSKKRP